MFPGSVGNWTPNATRFPRGLGPVGAAAAEAGLKFLLWFEPERVAPGTELWGKPELYTRLEPDECRLCDQDPTLPCGLLDLGDPAARGWAIDMVSDMVTEANLSWYRQDFNTLPARFWAAADANSSSRNGGVARAGLSEAKHIAGLYQFWDTLVGRHPSLAIDNCASGGRRIDMETLRRSVPLWRSDHCWDDPASQAMAWGLSHFLPFHGLGSVSPDNYSFASGMGSVISAVVNVYSPPPGGFPDWSRDLEAFTKDLKAPGTNGLFGCDFYSLTNYSDHAVTPPTLAPDGWIAWQYHNGSSPEPCESERGVVLAFRRAANGSQAAVPRSFALRGLSPSRRYALTPWDDAVLAPQTVSGAQLLHGLLLSLPPKSSAVVPYRCVASSVKTDDGQGADGSHLKYLSFYGLGYYNLFEMAKQSPDGRPFANLMSEGLFSQQVAAFDKFKVPGLYGDISSRWEVPDAWVSAETVGLGRGL